MQHNRRIKLPDIVQLDGALEIRDGTLNCVWLSTIIERYQATDRNILTG